MWNNFVNCDYVSFLPLCKQFEDKNTKSKTNKVTKIALFGAYSSYHFAICDPPSINQPYSHLVVLQEIQFQNIQLQKTDLSFVLCLCVKQ